MAIAAIKGDQTIAEFVEAFRRSSQLHRPVEIAAAERAAEAFGGDAGKASGPDIAELHAKIGRLALENGFLERALGHSTGRAQAMMIVTTLCRFRIKRSCLSTVLGAQAVLTPVPISEADLNLMREIDRLNTEYPFAGARMLRDMLRKRGYLVLGRRHVGRLMRLMGIEALYRKKKGTKTNPEHTVYPYLLRNLKIDRPNQVWAADISYIPMREGFLYLFAILDWATRKVLEWRLSNPLTTDFCIDGLEAGMAESGIPSIRIRIKAANSQMRTSSVLLKSRGIAGQHGRKGRLARQRVRGALLALDQVRGGLSSRLRIRERGQTLHGRYIAFYNEHRPHSSLDGRTPDEIYFSQPPAQAAWPRGVIT